MKGRTSATGSLCIPVVAMMDVLGQQEPKARIGPLPLADGGLKLHATLLRSTDLASVSDQESPQATNQKVDYPGAGKMLIPATYFTHRIRLVSFPERLLCI